jgi:hypothetical protein
MPEQFKPLTLFRGAEIATEVAKAVQAIPAGNTIVEMKAGENMPITICYAPYDEWDGDFPEYAWDGEKFRNIGYL